MASDCRDKADEDLSISPARNQGLFGHLYFAKNAQQNVRLIFTLHS